MSRKEGRAPKHQPTLLLCLPPGSPGHVAASPQPPYLDQKGGGSAGWGPEGQGGGTCCAGERALGTCSQHGAGGVPLCLGSLPSTVPPSPCAAPLCRALAGVIALSRLCFFPWSRSKASLAAPAWPSPPEADKSVVSRAKP